jgi:hypothetical protein
MGKRSDDSAIAKLQSPSKQHACNTKRTQDVVPVRRVLDDTSGSHRLRRCRRPLRRRRDLTRPGPDADGDATGVVATAVVDDDAVAAVAVVVGARQVAGDEVLVAVVAGVRSLIWKIFKKILCVKLQLWRRRMGNWRTWEKRFQGRGRGSRGNVLIFMRRGIDLI